MAMNRRPWLAAIVVGASVLTLAACSTTGPSAPSATSEPDTQNQEPQGVEGRPSLDEFCGDAEVKVAYIVGFGGNSWRKTALAEIQDEASQCEGVTVDYYDANGDQTQYISMVNSATAQGYDAIITYDDFGAAAIPALKSAFDAGVVVVPFEGDPTGVVGEDYTGFVSLDLAYEAEEWAAFLERAIPDGGGVAYLGGPAGNPLSEYLFDVLGENIDGTSIELLGDGPIATNWTPTDTQKAASGLFSQFPDLAGVVADYLGGEGPAIVNAFTNADQPLVPLTGGSATNELVCQYHDLSPTNPNFQLFSLDGDIAIGRVALRHAVAIFLGEDDDESWVFRRSVGIDTTNDIVPECQPDLPPDLPLNSTLSDDALAEVFAN